MPRIQPVTFDAVASVAGLELVDGGRLPGNSPCLAPGGGVKRNSKKAMNRIQTLNLLDVLPEQATPATTDAVPQAEQSTFGIIIWIALVSAIVSGCLAFALEPTLSPGDAVPELAIYRIGLRWALLAAALQVGLSLLCCLPGMWAHRRARRRNPQD